MLCERPIPPENGGPPHSNVAERVTASPRGVDRRFVEYRIVCVVTFVRVRSALTSGSLIIDEGDFMADIIQGAITDAIVELVTGSIESGSEEAPV